MRNANLFGGAISINLPYNLIDASEIRDVPDNQEVFIHGITDQSIMIDIMEMVTKPNLEAIRTHLKIYATLITVQEIQKYWNLVAWIMD